MARDYTIGEACDELRCSRKTLNDWLEAEGINSNDLPRGEIDKRSRMIPRALLVSMSKKRKRPLSSDLESSGISGSEDAFSTLLKEVRLLRGEVEALDLRDDSREAEVQQNIEQAVESISSRFTEQLTQFPMLENKVKDFDQKVIQLRQDIESMVIDLITEQFDQALHRMREQLPTIVSTQVQDYLRATREHQEHQTRTIVGPMKGPSTTFPSPTTGSSAAAIQRSTSSVPVELSTKQQLIISTIPTNKAKGERPSSFYQITRTKDGRLVAFGEFVELHGISLSTAKHAKNRRENPLPAVRVRWPKANGYIDWALDVTGQAKLYEFYSIKPEFQLCELCPHTSDKYEPLKERQNQETAEP